MKFHYLFIFLCVFFVGCSGVSRKQISGDGALLNKPVKQVEAETVMVDDAQNGTHIFTSPFFPNKGAILYLKSTVSRQFHEGYVLCLAMNLEEGVSFDQVESKTIRALELKIMDEPAKKPGQVVYGVELGRWQLNSVLFPGIQLKLSGEKGSSEFLFPDNYVKGFLRAVDSGVENLKKAQASTNRE